ncbi:MAG: peptide-methionine (S)-S-oxide reductase MsrA [Bacteroidota bacterium]|nr:peptide-methionine (S)-S-oxide reductase MsrA [Bacteroidota bacterium]
MIYALSFIVLLTGQCTSINSKPINMGEDTNRRMSGIDTATLGTGCFWCSEAIFQQLKGVIKVIPGYSGGQVKNPSYQQVCLGTTGHAEVCQIIYDTEIISFDELLEVFWLIHDPTSLNRQGNDVGTQYRSVVFYHNAAQKEAALEYKEMLKASQAYPKPVVTEISPYQGFYKAEDYHLNYYQLNRTAPYCVYVIAPKIEKFKKVFKDKLKIPLNAH